MSSATTTLRLCAAAVALQLAGARAHAQDASPPSHQYALTIERFAGLEFTYGRVDTAQEDRGVDFAGFVLGGPRPNPVSAPRVGFDFITAGNFVVGGTLGFATQSLTFRLESSLDEAPKGSLWTLLFGARAGYRAHLGPIFDIVPRAGLTLLTGTLSFPGNRSCSSGFDPMTGLSTMTTCTSVSGPSGSVFGGMFSLDVVGRVRLTPGFFIDSGLAYDHVLFANFSTMANGSARTMEQDTSGVINDN